MANVDRCLNVWDLRDGGEAPPAEGRFRVRRPRHRRPPRGHRQPRRLPAHQAAPPRVGGCLRRAPPKRCCSARKPACRWSSHRPAPRACAGIEGELQLAKAAAKAGIPLTMSTASMTAMEKIAEQAGGRLWFQLYVWKRRDLSLPGHRAGEPQRLRGADRHRRLRRLAQPRIQRAQRFWPAIQARLAVHVDMALHPAWTLGVMGRYLTPRYAEARELSRRVPGIDHQRRRPGRRHARGFPDLGRHRRNFGTCGRAC